MINIKEFPSYFVAKDFVSGITNKKGIEFSYECLNDIDNEREYDLIKWMMENKISMTQKGSVVYQVV